MKKIYFSFFAFLASSAAILAQPTLRSANFAPSIGDTELYYIADSSTVINNTVGADVTFDYSELQGDGETQTQYTINPENTTYSSDFPGATLADSSESFPINKNYSQLHATDSITKNGIVANIPSFGNIVAKYNSNPEITMKFPFNYADTYFDNYSGSFSIVYQGFPVSTDGNGNVTVNADAWGTLLLPSGVSIDSVIRIKFTEYLITDPIVIPLLTTIPSITANGVNINYYKPSLSKYPLLSILNGSYTQNGDVIESSNIIISQYPLDPITGVNEINTAAALNIFPNPSIAGKSNITINLTKTAKVRLEVFNSLGQNIAKILNKTLPQGRNNVSLNTSNMSKGIYFVNLIIDEKLSTEKLVIE